MRHFSRIGFVSAAAAPWALCAVAAMNPPIAPGLALAPAMDAAATPLGLTPPPGRYLALHFLSGDPASRRSFVESFLSASPGTAGVMHAFILRATPDEARTWAAQLDAAAASIYTDPAGAVSADRGIAAAWAAGMPITVVLGPGGAEVLRRTGASAADALTPGRFAELLVQKTRRPALADYNIPKDGGPAVDGYDVVAYFTLGKAVKGRPSLASTYRGVTYHFSTDEHRRLFAADPERYLPTYGGWCASAMGAKGTKVEIDPTRFKIKGGRLFLFYKDFFSDALKDWNKHEREWEPAADTNWERLTSEPPTRPGAIGPTK